MSRIEKCLLCQRWGVPHTMREIVNSGVVCSGVTRLYVHPNCEDEELAAWGEVPARARGNTSGSEHNG
jgi:hypothetical protein